MASLLEARTPGFNPYSVKYSPYYDSRLAVASSSNYGIVGNGRLFILGLGPQGIQIEKTYDTNDAQYDLAWSEINENQCAVACGDGSIKLFDLNVPDFPVMNFHEHKRETFSVCWNPVTKDTFLSSSWDGTIKIWSPTRPSSLKTLPVGNCTYSASFSPHNPSLISSVSSDSHLRLFDLRTPVNAKYHLVATIPIHSPPQIPGSTILPRLANGTTYAGTIPSEVLTHDWNKYSDTVIATGGFAVRKLQWSPHARDVLCSAGYDMTVRVWSDGSALPPQMAGAGPGENVIRCGQELGLMNRHTEFATGVDWCLFGTGGWVASVGWDERVLVWDAHTLLRR
ncbi:WD40-repeat-containing domain protein [Apiosordaria backusii]|uniref:Peroxin-7 n=1 Tax=Apiosordaria backusii TaxID=314023 RepID=A0AA40BKC1_9PEZI|nr:WD40-repeat-containing domain protein [Apiosordaria backusii]